MTLAFHIGQLRHAYASLAEGRVRDQRQFAEGLIAPTIRFLETQGIEAQRAETVKQDSVHESPVANGDAPSPQRKSHDQ